MIDCGVSGTGDPGSAQRRWEDREHATVCRRILHGDAHGALAEVLAHGAGVAEKETLGAAALHDRLGVEAGGRVMAEEEIRDAGQHVPVERAETGGELVAGGVGLRVT